LELVSVLPRPLDAQLTLAPGITLLNASRTVTVITDWLAPELAVIGLEAATDDWLADGAPTVADAVKVTGLPIRPVDVAVSVLLLVPAAVPSVQLVACAIPNASVATGVTGLTLPPPPVTANVTDWEGTGFENWSRTITDGAMATLVFTTAD